MKPTAAMISTLAVAYAASPDHSFNIPVWQTAGAKNCRGANTMTVTSTPEALTWYFYDMETTYPGDSQTTSDVGFCVMENEIGDGPPDWRFAVDTIEISGSGKLTGGAWIDSLVTVLSMDLGYPVDPSLPLAEQEWALRVGKIGYHELKNTTLTSNGKDLDGAFNIKATPDSGAIFSPCFNKNMSHDTIMMLFGHQTQLFMGQKPDATDPHGKINKDLKVALNLKWEKCDSTVDTIEKWGRASDAPKGWNPRF